MSGYNESKFPEEDIRALEKECEKINTELMKLGEEAREAFNDNSDEPDDDIYRDEYRDEVVIPIEGIMEKYGYEPCDASDILGGGDPDGYWDYGQTLTYRKVIKGMVVYVDVYTVVHGIGSFTDKVSISLFRLYSYDYDDQDRPVIHFARRLTENGWEDCTEELKEEL